MVVPTASTLAAVAAGPSAAAASVPRRAAARLRVTQMLRCARLRATRRAPWQAFSSSPTACPDRRRCAAAMPAMPRLGRERADVRARPRVLTAYWPAAREGVIQRLRARRGGDVCRRPEPAPWLRPGLWHWARTWLLRQAAILPRVLAVEAARGRLLRRASTGPFGACCSSRGGARRRADGASDRVRSQ